MFPFLTLRLLSLFSKWLTFFLYTFAILGCGAYLFYQSYQDGRTKSFITLDKTSGVCKDVRGSKTCCEVPNTITGVYLADYTGRWNTEVGFDYVKNVYDVSVAGLQYTNEQWKSIMKDIQKSLYEIGVVRGSKRDFAWNMIAWASFTAISTVKGYLQFNTAADIGVIFDKPTYDLGYASAASDNHACEMKISTELDSFTHVLSISQNLNVSNNCVEKKSSTDTNIKCTNPCPDIFPDPGTVGYNDEKSTSVVFAWEVNMASVRVFMVVAIVFFFV